MGAAAAYRHLLDRPEARASTLKLVRWWMSHLGEHHAALAALIAGKRRVALVSHPLVRSRGLVTSFAFLQFLSLRPRR